MPIIVLSDVILSNAVISAGVRGKNNRLNNRVSTESGFQSINIVWSQSLREYELGIVPMKITEWQAIAALHEITDGGAYGFLMEDPADNAVTAGSVLLVSDDDGYQLNKRYVDSRSGRFKDRPITRPRLDSFVLMQDGEPMDPDDYELDEETGRLTIASLPDEESLSWEGRFYVPVHFKDDFIDWEMVAAGSMDQRFLAGPSVGLIEVRE